MGEFNIAPNTQIGRIDIDHQVYDHENAYHIEAEKYSRGGEFIENMVTDNMIEYCHRWFKLANIKEFLTDLDEYVQIQMHNDHILFGNMMVSWQTPITFSEPKKTVEPIVFFSTPFEKINPIEIYTKPSASMNYRDLMESRGGM